MRASFSEGVPDLGLHTDPPPQRGCRQRRWRYRSCKEPPCGRSRPLPEPDRVKTGIHGLDRILFGGFPRGNVVVVAGPPGTGKTTLGLEFIYRGAREFDEPGIIVTFEVSTEKVVRDAAQFGWDLRELEQQGRVKIISTTRRVFQQEVQEPESLLLTEATQLDARRMFI